MKHIRFFAVFGILISILASCSFFSTKGDTGYISFRLGQASSRNISGESFPMPIFTSASIIVSGPGMATRTVTLTPETILEPQSIEVTAGPSRRVQIYAKPDWAATKSYFETMYPNTVFTPPSLGQAYGANAVVEVVPNTSTDVYLVFSLVETKILLPSGIEYMEISNLKTTDSFNGDIEAASVDFSGLIQANTQFAFDRYGGLFFTKSEYDMELYEYNHTIYYAENEEVLYASPTQGGALYTSDSEGSLDIAYDRSNNCLYSIDKVNFYNLYRMDLSQIDTETPLPSVEDLGTLFDENEIPFVAENSQIAVDNDGYVYFTAYTNDESNNTTTYQLVKIQPGEESYTIVDTADLLDLGLGFSDEEMYFSIDSINDMIIRDGRLYIAASREQWEYDELLGEIAHVTGRIAEIRLSDLALVRTYGGGETTPPDASSTRLFGPTRFLGFGPRKLYFSDEAVIYPYEEGTPVSYNRLAELNLDTGAIQVRPVDEASEAYFFKSTGY